MTSRAVYDWKQIHKACTEINRQMAQDNWKPSFIISPSRGGLTAGTMMSHYYNCKLFPYPHPNMPNDLCNLTALGAMTQDEDVLVMDDICDTGSSFADIKNVTEQMPWQSCKFAAIHYNIGQDAFEPDYYAVEINKLEDPRWIVYPWEEWWRL